MSTMGEVGTHYSEAADSLDYVTVRMGEISTLYTGCADLLSDLHERIATIGGELLAIDSSGGDDNMRAIINAPLVGPEGTVPLIDTAIQHFQSVKDIDMSDKADQIKEALENARPEAITELVQGFYRDIGMMAMMISLAARASVTRANAVDAAVKPTTELAAEAREKSCSIAITEN